MTSTTETYMIGRRKLTWSLGVLLLLNSIIPGSAGIFDSVGTSIQQSIQDVAKTIESSRGAAQDAQKPIEETPPNICTANPRLPQCVALMKQPKK
jgi:hypothetical protein